MAQGIAHKPTEETRQIVIDFLSSGRTHEAVARKLGIKIECLRKHYKYEIETALDDSVAKIGTTLRQRALQGDVASMIFFLKTQGRWRSEDSKAITESNDGMREEMIKLRAELDAKNRRDY